LEGNLQGRKTIDSRIAIIYKHIKIEYEEDQETMNTLHQKYIHLGLASRLFMFWLAVLVSLLLALSLPTGTALAGPVAPGTVQLIQPDGTVITVVPFGDEYYSGYAYQGYTILLSTSDYWVYAEPGQGGNLVPGKSRAGIDKLPLGLERNLRNEPALQAAAAASDLETPTGAPWSGSFGSGKVLIILTDFTPSTSRGTTDAQWNAKFFDTTPGVRSVKSWYEQASYGQFTLDPVEESYGTADDGVIAVTLPYANGYPWAGEAERTSVRDTLIAADPYIDYAALDTDHNGALDNTELHLVLIVRGYEESYGGTGGACTPNVWGHRWSMPTGTCANCAPVVDGVTIGASAYNGGYTREGEWHEYLSDGCDGSAPGHIATMGIMVHELGHDIDWPDTYDTDGGSSGVGNWDIMAGGSWGRASGDLYSGETPVLPDPFLKWYQGWLTPVQVTAPSANIAIPNSGQNNTVYQLGINPNGIDWNFNNNSGTGEYFLVENRQQVGYDAGLWKISSNAKGCFIWHIDETRTSANTANADPLRKLVDVEEADGPPQDMDLSTGGNSGDSGDPWPGSTGETAFSAASDPDSNWYDGSTSGILVSNISTAGTGCTLDFSGLGPTWTGSVSSDWNNAGNWSTGRVPNQNDNVVIPSGVPNWPDVNAAASVYNLTILDGALVNATADVSLDVYGNWSEQGSGYFNASAGAVVFRGNSAQTITAGASSHFNHLQIGDGSTTQTVTVGSDLDVDENLTIQPGAKLAVGTHTIRVGGNWTDNPFGFDPGTGTVILDGGAQTIKRAATEGVVYSNDLSSTAGWLIYDPNSGNTWGYSTSTSVPNSPDHGRHARYYFSSTVAADDWLFSSGFTLQAGVAYDIRFNYGARSATYPEKLAVHIGSAQSVGAMTTQLFDNNNVANTTWQPGSGTFTPTTTGTYYVGFHAYSDADQYELAVDDIIVAASQPDLAFFNLSVANGSTATFNDNAAVLNDVTVDAGGMLALGTYNLTVEGAATNNGALAQTRTVNAASAAFLNLKDKAGTVDKYWGATIEPGSNNLGSTTVTVRGNQLCPSATNGVLRCFDIVPTTSLASAVTFNYSEAERNGTDNPNMLVYHWNEAAWEKETGTTSRGGSGDGQWARAEGIDAYSPFALNSNRAPVAGNDSYTTNEDTPLTIPAPGVLSNDTDNGPLTAVKVSDPSHGTLTLNADGSFSYTPAANWNGSDSFTYKANDGASDSNIATVNLTVNPVNDAPVAVDDSYSTDENTPLTIATPGVLGNDTDIDSSTLTAALESGPAHGTLILNADGSFTYTPVAGYYGPDSFTYIVNDGGLYSNVGTVSLTVNHVNHTPVAQDQSVITDQDTPVAITLVATDPDNDPLTYNIGAGPAHGTLSGTGADQTYTPNAGYYGPDNFTFTATDGTLASNVATVSITVTHVNHAPVAVADSYSTDEDTPLTVPTAGVLANDADAESNPLSAALVTGPAHGTLTLNTDGSFSYTPAANWNGSDSFTYKANDGALDSNTATVTLIVNPVNDAPVADDQAVTTAEDTAKAITLTGSDVEGSALTFTVVSGPAHGSLSGTAPDVIYTPDANYNGPDSFTFKISDGGLESNIATVSITVTPVNDAPVAGDDSYSTSRNVPLTIAAPGVLGNDTDIDSTVLTVVPESDPAHGTLTLTADGSFTYTPSANYAGPDSFTYRANDGAADSNVATVTINVVATNRAPVAVDDSYIVDEDAPLTISASGVLSNDTDEDGNTLTAVLVSGSAHGTLAFNADGSFTYAPAANWSGSDSFTYKANDGAGDSNTATVTITVNAVNDAPVVVNDSYNTNEDAPLNMAVPGVLSNDTDVEGNTLTTVLVTGPAHGALTFNTDGSFTYTPAASYSGPDSFTYQANDGAADSNIATVDITVTHVNHAPVAQDQMVTTPQDTPLAITLVAPDSDDDPLTYSIVDEPAHGTLSGSGEALTYTPDAGYKGSDSFTFKANDGTLDSNIALVTITVMPVNHAPIAADDVFDTNEDTPLLIPLPGLLGNDTDIDGNELTAILATGPAHGTLILNAAGSFTYTPATNYNGTDSFTYKASDGTLESNAATVVITINPVNDTPVAADDGYIIDEDTPLTIAAPGLLSNDNDVDGLPTLTAVLVNGPGDGTLLLNPDGSFTYTPNANWNGSDNFTYRASDGTASSNDATVTITVNAVNDAPIAADDSYTTDRNTALTITAPGILGNDTDVEATALTAVLVTDPSHGTLTLNADGSFTYTPESDWSGTDSFTYNANDGAADSNIATVTIGVNATNRPPVAVNDTYGTDEDTVLTVNLANGVLSNDTDADHDPLTATKLTDPANGTLVFNPDGSFSYTPNANWYGNDSFTYQVSDGTASSNVATVTITVNAMNDTPVLVQPADQTNQEGDTVSLQLQATDPESDPLTFAVSGLPQALSVDTTTGLITGTLNYASAGVHNITVTVTDSNNAADTKTFVWTVSDIQYALTVNIVGNGTVSRLPDQTGYDPGTEVTLTATPASGWVFSGWSGDLQGTNNPVTITINSNTTVTATFIVIPPTCYLLTLNHTGQGSDPVASPANSAGCSTGQYVAGENIALNGAIPATGWQISSWSGTNNDAGTTGTNSVTMPAVAHAATVNYTQLQYTLTINIVGSGSVTRHPDQETYHHADTVQLTAVPAAGWSFTGWSGALTGTANPIVITMDSNKSVSATFTQIPSSLVYGVHDFGFNSSLFFTIDPQTLVATPLGSLRIGYDIEAIAAHPTTGEMYAASGSNNLRGQRGYLFRVNKQTGTLTAIGSTGYSSVVGLSFRPDGTLWGWAKGKGLIQLNLTTGKGTLKKSSSLSVGDIAWNADGSILYIATSNGQLHTYQPANNKLTRIATNLPRNVEALDMRADGLLMLGVHDSNRIRAYDPITKQLVTAQYVKTPYDDVEGIAWP
jgi:M6 family metalloprotease-like protein